MSAHDFQKLVAREHQFGNRGHKAIERVDADADRMTGELFAGLGCGFFGLGGYGRDAALIALPGHRLLLRRRLRLRRRRLMPRHARQLLDQVGVIAGGFLLFRLELGEDRLDAVDGRKNERHSLGGDRHAVAEFTHQGFGGMRQRFEPGQSKKSASALDGVDETKNIAENAAVIRLLLETHKLGVDEIEALAGFREKVAQQLVHSRRLVATGKPPAHAERAFHRQPRTPRAVLARRAAPDRAGLVCCQRV